MVKNIFINKFNSILKYGFILTSILLVLLSCTNEPQSYKLNLNENTYLLDGKPYTGVVIDKQKNSGRIIKSFECIDGKIEGLFLYYFKSGKICYKRYYKQGLLDGISKHFFENGNLYTVENFKSGNPFGEQIEYNDDDENSIRFLKTLKNGVLNGKYYHKRFNTETTGYYKNDLMNGLWVYKEDGKVFAKGHFINGDGTKFGATGIPRNGRVGKWYFYEPPFIQIQEYLSNSEWFLYKSYRNGKLVYSSKANINTDEEIVYLDNL
jgi:antitoxin component YwqK of YwqJK toxin-antitoxin module